MAITYPNKSTTEFVAGPYLLTVGSYAIGGTEDGFSLRPEHQIEDITPQEYGGKVIKDGIYQGMNLILETSIITFRDCVQTNLAFPFQSFGSSYASWTPGAVEVGRPISEYAVKLTLSPVIQMGNNQDTYYFGSTATGNAVPINDSGSWQFNGSLRKVRVQFRILPIIDSTAVSGVSIMRWFTRVNAYGS
jgi:hypothetical protein